MGLSTEIGQDAEKVFVSCLNCEGKGWEIVQGDHYMPMQETCSECAGQKMMWYDRVFIQAFEPTLLETDNHLSNVPVPWLQQGPIVMTGKAAQIVAEGLSQTEMTKEKRDFVRNVSSRLAKPTNNI